MQELEKIWMNGALIDWADAKVHVGAHGLHYGSGVFEGIRAYETPKGSAVFRLSDHLQRLQNSARLLNMDLGYSVGDLRAACMDLIGANGVPECYLRPIAFFGYGELGVAATGNPVDVAIMSWPWGTYLGAEGLERGIRAKISSWTRVGPNVIPHVAKATGIYLNSMLAVMEANRSGYDEAILLTHDGFIADGSGENVFLVKEGTIYTPDLSASILPGITRDTIIQIAQDLGYTVVEKQLIRTDLYLADEVFMTGTAAEVTPLREVDDQTIGPPGPVTLAIQQAYLDTVRGHSERWSHWLEYASTEPVRAQALKKQYARSRSRARGSTSVRKSSCSKSCARGGCRSARGSTGSRRRSPRASARPMRLRSRAAQPACICSARSPGSVQATR
jgi:branched-chain amino acid aminotransferase